MHKLSKIVSAFSKKSCTFAAVIRLQLLPLNDIYLQCVTNKELK